MVSVEALAEKSFAELLQMGVETGMSSDEVGQIVVEGIRDNPFWVYTRAAPADSIRTHSESRVHSTNPVCAPERSDGMLDAN